MTQGCDQFAFGTRLRSTCFLAQRWTQFLAQAGINILAQEWDQLVFSTGRD